MTSSNAETGREPDKVTLEVTRDAWSWTVSIAGHVLARHEMRRVERGCFKGVGKGGIYEKLMAAKDRGKLGDIEDWLEELADAIEDGSAHGIADILNEGDLP